MPITPYHVANSRRKTIAKAQPAPEPAPVQAPALPPVITYLGTLLRPPTVRTENDLPLARKWLKLASLYVTGYAPQVCVLRRYTTSGSSSVEIRRRSEEDYLIVASQGAPAPALLLSRQGELIACTLDGQRFVRNRPGDKISDEIYLYTPIADITSEHLKAVRQRVMQELHPQGYAHWKQLSPEEREVLVTFGGTWKNAQEALQQCDDEESIETLQLFLSEKSSPELREEVLNAGSDGRLRPGVGVLPWLLSRNDWNINPGLVAMAKSAVQDEPERAWQLTTHPNAQIRLRLADLLCKQVDLLGWLTGEKDLEVRKRILLSLEYKLTPRQLVQSLHQEKNQARREALGWALVNWSTGIEDPADWQALNQALFTPIGPKNKRALKEKLAQHGHLSWKARLLFWM